MNASERVYLIEFYLQQIDLCSTYLTVDLADSTTAPKCMVQWILYRITGIVGANYALVGRRRVGQTAATVSYVKRVLCHYKLDTVKDRSLRQSNSLQDAPYDLLAWDILRLNLMRIWTTTCGDQPMNKCFMIPG